MPQPPPPRRLRRLAPLPRGLVDTARLALLCNLVLELSRLTQVETYPWQFKTPTYVPMFLLGTAVLWLVVGLVHAVVGRLWLTTALAAVATATLAVADHEKARLREEPLYPSDWEHIGDVGFLTQMVAGRLPVLLAVVVLVAAAVTVTAVRASRRPADNPQAVEDPVRDHRPRRRRTRVALRVVTCGACVLSLGYLGSFNAPGNAARGAYELLGASWQTAGQQGNYLRHGFVGGFLYNLQVPIPVPRGYDADEMARITATYRAAADRINRSRDPHGLADVNVVMILSESFSDPQTLAGVQLDTDPIPYIRSLMATTTSGQMLAQAIGGKTANMEFEALTGMSMSRFPPQLQVAYQVLVPDHQRFPSAVGWLRREGHRAVAIHPYTTRLYRRRDVYRIFGFDEFVYDELMHSQRRIGHEAYISDAAAFDEVRQRIEAEERSLLLNVVTMQNHMPYTDRYDDPVRVLGPDGEPSGDIGQYVRGLTHTDRAVRDLIQTLGRSDEKTVVVFYGDHLPGGIYRDSVFGLNSRRTLHQTPFFVWANFPGPAAAQPTTSPIHFMDLVLERADAAVPPYYALLRELRREIPAMEGGMMVGRDDQLLEPGRLSPRARRLLRDYRLVQYDLAVGERYSERAMFAPVP